VVNAQGIRSISIRQLCSPMESAGGLPTEHVESMAGKLRLKLLIPEAHPFDLPAPQSIARLGEGVLLTVALSALLAPDVDLPRSSLCNVGPRAYLGFWVGLAQPHRILLRWGGMRRMGRYDGRSRPLTRGGMGGGADATGSRSSQGPTARLARKYPPEREQGHGAEARFKEVGEASKYSRSRETRRRLRSAGKGPRPGEDFARSGLAAPGLS